MGDDLGAGAWSMRLQYKPMVRYIWLGALIMALGGIVAATDRRYRRRRTTADDRVAARARRRRAERAAMRSLKFIIPLALFVLLGLALLKGLSLNPREVPSPLIGKPAPEFSLPSLQDASYPVSSKELLGQAWV